MPFFLPTLIFLAVSPCVLSQVVLTQSDPAVKKPGESHKLSCAVTGFDINNYYMSWIMQKPAKALEWLVRYYRPGSGNSDYSPAIQGRFTASKDSSNFYLQMDRLKAEDTAVYYCAREAAIVRRRDYNWYFDYWGKGTMVTVTSATATAPSVFPLSPCNQDMSSASQVSMACLVSGYFPQPAIVKWNSGAITSGIQDFPALLQPSSSLYLSSSQLTVPASKWQSESYQCNVAHTATSSAINKRIEPCSSREPRTPDVQLLHSSCSRKTDDSTVELVCFISGFYPNTVTVNWLVDGVSGVLAAHTESPKKDATGGTFSTTSTANVTQVAWKQGKIYTCQVIHQGTKVEKHASKCPGDSGACATNGVKMSVKPPTPADLYMNGDPKLICVISHLESDVGLRVSWTWEKAGALEPEPLETSSDSDGTFTAESTLIIPKQSWLAGNIYTCKAEHPSFVAPLSKPIKKNGGPRTRPHVYLFRPHNEELKSRDPNVCLTCLVKGFNPKEISIKWLENHNVVTEGSHVTTPVQLDSSQDSYFVYSKLTVPKANWNDGNSYTCHVVHEGLDMKYTQRTIERTLEFFVATDDRADEKEEELDSLWTTILVFFILFLLSVCYSATVTLFKVKWLFSTVLHLKNKPAGPEYKNVIQEML